MAQGNIGDAMTATFNAFAQSNVLQAALLQVVYEAIDYAKGAGVAEVAAQRGQTLLLYLNVLSGALVTYDVGVLTTQLAESNRADVFTVDVIAPKVNLNPSDSHDSSDVFADLRGYRTLGERQRPDRRLHME